MVSADGVDPADRPECFVHPLRRQVVPMHDRHDQPDAVRASQTNDVPFHGSADAPPHSACSHAHHDDAPFVWPTVRGPRRHTDQVVTLERSNRRATAVAQHVRKVVPDHLPDDRDVGLARSALDLEARNGVCVLRGEWRDVQRE